MCFLTWFSQNCATTPHHLSSVCINWVRYHVARTQIVQIFCAHAVSCASSESFCLFLWHFGWTAFVLCSPLRNLAYKHVVCYALRALCSWIQELDLTYWSEDTSGNVSSWSRRELFLGISSQRAFPGSGFCPGFIQTGHLFCSSRSSMWEAKLAGLLASCLLNCFLSLCYLDKETKGGLFEIYAVVWCQICLARLGK